MFTKELPGLPPKRAIDFSIYLKPEAESTSKACSVSFGTGSTSSEACPISFRGPFLLGRGPFLPIRRCGSLLLMRRRGCSDPGSGNPDSGGSGSYLFQAGVVVLGDPL